MGASNMAEDPINSREFNQAMESLRDILDRLERSQEVLSNDIKKLYDLHRNCMFAQSEKSFKYGQTTEKIQALENRTHDLESANLSNVNHKRQIFVGIGLTALAAIASLITTFLTRK